MVACLSWASVGQRGPLWGSDCQRHRRDICQFVVGMSDKIVPTGPCDAPGCGRSDDVRYRWAKKPELDGKQVCPKSACQDWGGTRDLEKEKAARQAKAAAAKAEKEAAKAAEAAAKEEAAAAFAAASTACRFTSFRGASMRAAATAAPAAAPQAATPPAAPAAAPTLACYRAWEQLSAAEQATASSLGFKQWKWDASVLGLDDDVNEGIPRLRAYPGVLREAGLGLLDVYAILGKRLHNPVDMTVLQRGSPLSSPSGADSASLSSTGRGSGGRRSSGVPLFCGRRVFLRLAFCHWADRWWRSDLGPDPSYP